MNNKEGYKINFTNFEKKAADTFRRFQNNEKYSDLLLVCDDGRNQDSLTEDEIIDRLSFHAHLLLVGPRSPFIDRAASRVKKVGGAKDGKIVLFLAGIAKPIMKLILDFIYEGSLLIPKADLREFIKAAKFLEIEGLADKNVGDFDDSDVEDEREQPQHSSPPKPKPAPAQEINNKRRSLEDLDNQEKQRRMKEIQDKIAKLKRQNEQVDETSDEEEEEDLPVRPPSPKRKPGPKSVSMLKKPALKRAASIAGKEPKNKQGNVKKTPPMKTPSLNEVMKGKKTKAKGIMKVKTEQNNNSKNALIPNFDEHSENAEFSDEEIMKTSKETSENSSKNWGFSDNNFDPFLGMNGGSGKEGSLENFVQTAANIPFVEVPKSDRKDDKENRIKSIAAFLQSESLAEDDMPNLQLSDNDFYADKISEKKQEKEYTKMNIEDFLEDKNPDKKFEALSNEFLDNTMSSNLDRTSIMDKTSDLNKSYFNYIKTGECTLNPKQKENLNHILTTIMKYVDKHENFANKGFNCRDCPTARLNGLGDLKRHVLKHMTEVKDPIMENMAELAKEFKDEKNKCKICGNKMDSQHFFRLHLAKRILDPELGGPTTQKRRKRTSTHNKTLG